MRRGLRTVSAVAQISVGDSAASVSGSFNRSVVWSTGPSGVLAPSAGTLSRFRVSVNGAQSSRQFAFFTVNPTTDVITAIGPTITSTLADGVNEFTTTPIAANAGDHIGIWVNAFTPVNYHSVASGGTVWGYGSTTSKPSNGNDITALATTSVAGAYALISGHTT